jgi:transposase
LLGAAGLPVICVETRHMAPLSEPNKSTDTALRVLARLLPRARFDPATD